MHTKFNHLNREIAEFFKALVAIKLFGKKTGKVLDFNKTINRKKRKQTNVNARISVLHAWLSSLFDKTTLNPKFRHFDGLQGKIFIFIRQNESL